MKIKIGTVAKPFGIRGEIKVRPTTDFVEERFKVGAIMELVTPNQRKTVTIKSARPHQDTVLVMFEGYESLTAVEGLQLATLEMERDDLHELEEGEYYFVDLIDCEVFDQETRIGRVVEVMDMKAHPVLRIEREDTSVVMIPFVDQFIADVDLDMQRIDIITMEGLL